MRKLLSWAGHRGREALLWPQILAAPALLRGAAPRLVFLPSSPLGSGDLRAKRMAQELRAQGWAALSLPPQLEMIQRARLLRGFRPDLIVFQKCRHRLNRAELACGFPFVLDLDDADFSDPAQRPHLEAMARAGRGVLAGSRHIRDWAEGFTREAHVVWTGTPITSGPRPPQDRRAPIVAWAQAEPLNYPAELEFLTGILTRARIRAPELRLRLYGVNDAGARQALQARFGDLPLETLPSLPYAAFLKSLRDVAVGLSPIIPASPFSRGKSFGKILGYLDAEVPVICADQADHALFFTAQSGVVSDDPEAWVAAIAGLLQDPARRSAMAAAGFQALQDRLSLGAAARRTGEILRQLA